MPEKYRPLAGGSGRERGDAEEVAHKHCGGWQRGDRKHAGVALQYVEECLVSTDSRLQSSVTLRGVRSAEKEDKGTYAMVEGVVAQTYPVLVQVQAAAISILRSVHSLKARNCHYGYLQK